MTHVSAVRYHSTALMFIACAANALQAFPSSTLSLFKHDRVNMCRANRGWRKTFFPSSFFFWKPVTVFTNSVIALYVLISVRHCMCCCKTHLYVNLIESVREHSPRSITLIWTAAATCHYPELQRHLEENNRAYLKYKWHQPQWVFVYLWVCMCTP